MILHLIDVETEVSKNKVFHWGHTLWLAEPVCVNLEVYQVFRIIYTEEMVFKLNTWNSSFSKLCVCVCAEGESVAQKKKT